MTDQGRPSARGGGDHERAREGRNGVHEESTAERQRQPSEPMTDDSNPTERPNRPATEPSRTTSGTPFRRRVKDRDHTSPVDGHNRAFSRANEERSAKTDGGRRRESPDEHEDDDGARAVDDESAASDDAEERSSAGGDETTLDDGERPWRRVKDRDHTSPVDGHNRTFERGDENANDGK